MMAMSCWKSLVLLLWPVICHSFEVGYTASMVNFPFVAAIYYKEGKFNHQRPFCTGTIITDDYVLTTAGCMHRRNPEKPKEEMYKSVLQHHITAWIGSPFGFVKGSRLVDAQMVVIQNFHFPRKQDLTAIWKSDAPPYNNYTVNGFTYFYLDFCLLKTQKQIIYNNFVHGIPFDVENVMTAMDFWNTTIHNDVDTSGNVVPDCYAAGWGGLKDLERPNYNTLYRLRYVKARFTERIHCVVAYCGNCTLCYLRYFNESTYACFSSYMTGDTCEEDEGAPLFCPWFGFKNRRGLGWGAMLGLLSGKMGSCLETKLPSMYNLIWMAYPFFSRIMHFLWPPPGHEWLVPQRDFENDYEQELD